MSVSYTSISGWFVSLNKKWGNDNVHRTLPPCRSSQLNFKLKTTTINVVQLQDQFAQVLKGQFEGACAMLRQQLEVSLILRTSAANRPCPCVLKTGPVFFHVH